MEVRGAAALRVKESDRISALARGFRAMGAEIFEYPDGFRIESRPLEGAVVDAAGDHRLAMAFAVAATGAATPTTITGAGAVDVSYPGFFQELERLTTRLPDLDPVVRSEIEHAVRRVADKLLHQPTVRVKELANEDGAVSYAAALAELFALDPEAVDAVTRVEGV